MTAAANSRVRAVLFDLDGTLVDTSLDITSAMNQSLDEHGLARIDVDRAKSWIGVGTAQFTERAVGPRFIELSRSVRARYEHCYAENPFTHARPYPGIVTLLEELSSEGLRLAVVTNKLAQQARQIVHHLFGSARFAVICGARSGRPLKPHPEMAKEALSALGVVPGEAVLVGDTEVDAQFAAAAGVRCLAVSWGFRSRATLNETNAVAVVDRAEQILNWVMSGSIERALSPARPERETTERPP